MLLHGFPVVDPRLELRPRVHPDGFVHPAIFELLPKATGYDARAHCVRCRYGVDVPDGEEAVRYWSCCRDSAEGCMVETRDGGVVTNVDSEYTLLNVYSRCNKTCERDTDMGGVIVRVHVE